jgi:hypothetical protein
VVVESFISGSPYKWLFAGFVVLYAFIVGLLWKRWTWGLKVVQCLVVSPLFRKVE